MNICDITKIRLHNQQIANPKFGTVKELVNYMGAIQAQDYPMSKWAIGLRVRNAAIADIENAMDRGEIIRTHVMRPTWHIVSAENIHWMLDLTAPRIRPALKAPQINLELPDSLIDKCCNIMQTALSKHKFLSREDLIATVSEHDIHTNRAYHLLLHAELKGLICSGENDGNNQTYALLEDRIAKPAPISREEAAIKLAEIYFESHSPATLNDFVWWSGLSIREARAGLEGIKTKMVPQKIDGQTYWFSETTSDSIDDSAQLLPAFDEFIISYANRDAIFSKENYRKAVSTNGIFKPIIVVNGEVTGLWKRSVKKDSIVIETIFFRTHSLHEKSLIEEAAKRYGNFLGMKIAIKL